MGGCERPARVLALKRRLSSLTTEQLALIEQAADECGVATWKMVALVGDGAVAGRAVSATDRDVAGCTIRRRDHRVPDPVKVRRPKRRGARKRSAQQRR